MLNEVRKQALIRSSDVTLVHVIEEESNSHVRRYGMTVEGEQLMGGLEQSVQNLRRFSIDPCIRLIRGEVVAVLESLSRDLGAELLVLGVPRKKKSLLRGASIQERIEKNIVISCRVVIAAKEHFSPETDLKDINPDQLTKRQVLSIDIYLVDLWFEHLHYHTDFIYQLLLYPDKEVDLSEKNCRFGQFLASLEGIEKWKKLTSILGPIHLQFHEVAAKMAKLSAHDHAGLQDLYVRESLPLSCRLKNELGHISLYLRSFLKNNPPTVPFLADESCPVTMPDLACYGPLLRAFNLGQDLCVLIQKKDSMTLQSNSIDEEE
ncbi:MAG TPA: universal stress protein [Desulfobulbaceae bacterium]|nr:universal stress protein [Desulfobulbaceae bacterium]